MDIKPAEGKVELSTLPRWWQTSFALDCFWSAALAAILIVLLHESLLGGKGLVPADGVLERPPWNDPTHPRNYLLVDQSTIFIPQHQFVHQQVTRGKFPLWNPNLGCGMPNLASMQGALLFPIQLLLSPIDPFYASGPAAFLKLFLAGWFTIWYLRLLGASRAAAFLSGTVFSLCGFMIVWLGHPHVNCAMWLPLLLYFVEKSFRFQDAAWNAFAAPILRNWIGFAVAFAFMLLGGHPPTAMHVTIAVGIYFLFRLIEFRRDQPFPRLGLLVVALVAGALLAAPQILPYLEYYRQSSSSLSSASLNRWATHLTPNSLIYFLLPQISGNPAAGFEDLAAIFRMDNIHNFNERTAYIGVLPLFLAICAVVCRRCKFARFYLLLAIGSALIVFGVPPFPFILRALPVLRDVNHVRLLLLIGFSAAVLAGLGWDGIRQMQSRQKAVGVAIGFWAVTGATLIWVWLTVKPQTQSLDGAHRLFLTHQIFVLVGGLIAIGVLVFWPKQRSRWFAQAICLGWAAGDLLWFGLGYNPAIPHDRYYPRTAAIEWLQQNASAVRIFGWGSALMPNTANVFDLSDVRGSDFMSLRRYEELITDKAGDFSFYSFASSFPQSFRLLNAKYVLSAGALPLNSDLFDLVYSREISIYRFKACLERALVVFDYQVEREPTSVLARVRSLNFDPRQAILLEEEPQLTSVSRKSVTAEVGGTASASITSYEADEVKIAASLPRPGFLLLLDTYFPGWTALVNNRATPIYQADYNFRAVSLPAGPSTIRFTYRPRSFQAGLALASASFLALVVVWFWRGRAPANTGQV
jgi:hypothetical protein